MAVTSTYRIFYTFFREISRLHYRENFSMIIFFAQKKSRWWWSGVNPIPNFKNVFRDFFSFSNLQLQVLRFLLTSQDFWKHSTYIITVYICMTYKLYILCTCSEGKNTTIFAAWWCWWETKVCNKGILFNNTKEILSKSCFHEKFAKKVWDLSVISTVCNS